MLVTAALVFEPNSEPITSSTVMPSGTLKVMAILPVSANSTPCIPDDFSSEHPEKQIVIAIIIVNKRVFKALLFIVFLRYFVTRNIFLYQWSNC